jgi:D-alanyl-D-alanine carboxypeptidase
MMSMLLAPVMALAAPFAALVMDARTGEVLYAENADTRLHPASLTKMMTLYVTFQAIERGEISLDTMVTISAHAAAQAPSKLGVKPGQRIAVRYLIRAAAIKSANDAATALAEAVGGSEPAFARRMTRTAKSLGMNNSTFKNANGLTATGHLTSARDMTILGRHLFYDFPQYYNIFSRRSADAGIAQVASTNRRFLDSYEGADGIKTGYTVPAGFNLTASAQRGNKRIIATILGGKSTAWRNQKMAELLDLGFAKAPNRATVQKPVAPGAVPDTPDDPAGEMLLAEADRQPDDAVAAAVAQAVVADAGAAGPVDADMDDEADGPAAAKTVRVALAVDRSRRPAARPAMGGGTPDAVPVAAPALVASETSSGGGTDGTAGVAVADVGGKAVPDGAPVADAAGVALAEPPAMPDGPVFAQTAPLQPETLAALAPVAPAAAPAGEEATVAAAGAATGSAAADKDAAAPEATAVAMAAPTGSPAEVVPDADPVPGPGSAEPIRLADGGAVEGLADPADALGLDIDAAVLAAVGEDDAAGGPAAPRPLARPPIGTTVDGDATIQIATAEVMPAPTAVPQPDAQTPAAELETWPAPAPSAPAQGGAATPREAATPSEQPPEIILAAATVGPDPTPVPEVVTRMSTSGGRQWGINIGRFGSRYEAERMLIQTALVEMSTLDEALRKVVGRGGGYDANFMGLTEESADLACRRLAARATDCTVIPPTG